MSFLHPPSVESQTRLVDQWNAAHGHRAGIPVVVRLDNGRELATCTNSTAWLMGGHTAVILLAGVSGAFSLARVRHDPTRKEDIIVNPGGES